VDRLEGELSSSAAMLHVSLQQVAEGVPSAQLECPDWVESGHAASDATASGSPDELRLRANQGVLLREVLRRPGRPIAIILFISSRMIESLQTLRLCAQSRSTNSLLPHKARLSSVEIK
jgi:hypothetical protein